MGSGLSSIFLCLLGPVSGEAWTVSEPRLSSWQRRIRALMSAKPSGLGLAMDDRFCSASRARLALLDADTKRKSGVRCRRGKASRSPRSGPRAHAHGPRTRPTPTAHPMDREALRPRSRLGHRRHPGQRAWEVGSLHGSRQGCAALAAPAYLAGGRPANMSHLICRRLHPYSEMASWIMDGLKRAPTPRIEPDGGMAEGAFAGRAAELTARNQLE